MKQSVYLTAIFVLTILCISCEEAKPVITNPITSQNVMERSTNLNGKVKSVVTISNEIRDGVIADIDTSIYNFNPSGFITLSDYFLTQKRTYNSNNDVEKEWWWSSNDKKWKLDETHHYTYDRYRRKIKDVTEHYPSKKHKITLYSWNYENQIVTEKFKGHKGGFDHVTRYEYDSKGNLCSELYHLKGKLTSQCYYKYDDLTNRLIRVKFISFNGVVVYTYVYNKKGHQISCLMKAKSFTNQKSVEVVFPRISYAFNVGEYRDDSNIVSQKLDKHGNWIYKKEDLDSVIYETKRKIAYYK